MNDNGARIEQVTDLPQSVPSSAPVAPAAGAELGVKLLSDILAEMQLVKRALQSLAGTVGQAMQQAQAQAAQAAAPPTDDDMIAKFQRAQRFIQMMQSMGAAPPGAAPAGFAPVAAPPAGLVATLKGCSPAHPWATQGCAACATALRTSLFGG